MKKLVLVVPDDFDAGSVISLVGRDLVQAFIGEYAPKVVTKWPPAKPNGVQPLMHPDNFLEPEIVTGREKAEYNHTPGLSRKPTPRNRPPKTTLRSVIETLGKEKEWFSGHEVEAITLSMGYATDSGWKALSNLKIAGLLEHDKTNKLWRLRTEH